jgi:cyclopropane-fatty-acyl-phospholipid synthase
MTPEQAAAATNRHYGLPPRIFEAFLDRRMKYTCGLYVRGDESLDEAQEAKLRFISRLLHVRGGERVLDIGCGWGGLLLYLAEESGCQATGITPAAAQAEYVRDRVRAAGLSDLVAVSIASVYDVELPEGDFDAVAMVGVIEAMPDLQTALGRAARWLRPGGRLYLSASCYRSSAVLRDSAARPGSRQVSDDIFGYGTMRPLSELVEATATAGLTVSGVYDLSSHYHRTIIDWKSRVAANRQTIEALRPGYADELLAYFDIANAGWGYSTKHYAITATRRRHGELEMVA